MNLDLKEIELPIRLVTERPMNDDELMRFCAANETLRVEREPSGEILVMTPSGFGTARINGRITKYLVDWAETDGRGVVTDSNGGYTLPDGSMRAPDAAWVSLNRLSRLSDQDKTGFAPVCPEFVIELRSPSDRLPELQAKMEQWIANGAEIAWLVDPIEKAITIYRLGSEPEHLFDPSSVQGTGPIAGFELVMARVWAA